MIVTPNASIIGATEPGIWIPGTTIIGGASSKPSIPPIDLTSSTLDPRIKYTGPVHFVMIEGGQEMSGVNDWVLEAMPNYLLGRHEPEPEATNYQGASQASDISVADYIATSNTTSSTVTGPNGDSITLFTSDRVKAALYDNGDAKWLVTEFTPTGTALTRVIMNGTASSDTSLRTYIARKDASNYCYGLSQTVPAGDVTASFYRTVRSGGVAAGIVQVESGTLATSPIITKTGQTATRRAATVVVDTTSASSMTVLYSNGESDTYPTPDDSFTIPPAQKNWGSRYMQRIEFR